MMITRERLIEIIEKYNTDAGCFQHDHKLADSILAELSTTELPVQGETVASPDGYQNPSDETWFDHPADLNLLEGFVDGVKLNEVYEIDVCWTGKQKFRVIKTDEDGQVEDVEFVSGDQLFTTPTLKPSVNAPTDNAKLIAAHRDAAIAWSVCASIHRVFGKGVDPLFSTRQTDFVKREEAARQALSDYHAQSKEQPIEDNFIPNELDEGMGFMNERNKEQL